MVMTEYFRRCPYCKKQLEAMYYEKLGDINTEGLPERIVKLYHGEKIPLWLCNHHIIPNVIWFVVVDNTWYEFRDEYGSRVWCKLKLIEKVLFT